MQAFRVEIVLPVASREALAIALEALTQLDAITLATTPGIPSIYASGVRYARESRQVREGHEVDVRDVRGARVERFNHLLRCLEIGRGDCDDLAPWRAAELRVQGIAASAVPIQTPSGMWHVVVMLPDGTIEDPSIELGMVSEQ